MAFILGAQVVSELLSANCLAGFFFFIILVWFFFCFLQFSYLVGF